MMMELDSPPTKARVEISRRAVDLAEVAATAKATKLATEEEDEEAGDLLSHLCGAAAAWCCRKGHGRSWAQVAREYVPILDWLGGYNFKSDFLSDVVAGFTVAIMHIPQGMAYANLAELDPIYGIYTAIFPVLIYTLLGPSRHVSMGTNPLTSILIGSVVVRYASDFASSSTTSSKNEQDLSFLPPSLLPSTTTTTTTTTTTPPLPSTPVIGQTFTKFELMTALSLLVGLWQLAFSLLRLGRLSWVLSDVLVSGFTTAAAVHVLASQLKGLLGIPLPSHSGALKLARILLDLFRRIGSLNWASLVISLSSITALVINNELLKPELSKHCSFPLPIQLVVVAVGTFVSFQFDLKGRYGVDTVGRLPTGFPSPVPPSPSVFPAILCESLVIAVVGYCITLSMAKIFAARFGYRVDGNQEMFSEGASNIFGSFFSSMPSGASMSRSAVQVSVGGRTQLTSAVSVAFLSLVILFAGPLFTDLPKAVLSSIIVVALKGMLLQYHDFAKFWAKSKLDGLLWLFTFCAVILLDVDCGLVAGLAMNLALLVYRGVRVRISQTVEIEDTGLFWEVDDKDGGIVKKKKDDILTLRIGGAVTFANFEAVMEGVASACNGKEASKKILDLSSVPYADAAGAKALAKWAEKGKKKEEKSLGDRLLASPTTKVERMLLQESKDLSEVLFPSVVDALRVARNSSSSSSFARTEFEAEEGGKEAEPDDSGLSRSRSQTPPEEFEGDLDEGETGVASTTNPLHHSTNF